MHNVHPLDETLWNLVSDNAPDSSDGRRTRGNLRSLTERESRNDCDHFSVKLSPPAQKIQVEPSNTRITRKKLLHPHSWLKEWLKRKFM